MTSVITEIQEGMEQPIQHKKTHGPPVAQHKGRNIRGANWRWSEAVEVAKECIEEFRRAILGNEKKGDIFFQAVTSANKKVQKRESGSQSIRIGSQKRKKLFIKNY